MTDQREHQRVQLPFEVELNHPSIGKVRSVARDISEGGIFVAFSAESLKEGSKLKVTVLNTALIETSPTPTVEMEVVRVAADGIGLKFSNQISRHLWHSVQRVRDEVAIGRDYFQVFQCALVVNRLGRLLVLQQEGRWVFPGDYLIVGQDWRQALSEYLNTELALPQVEFVETLVIDSSPNIEAKENATLSVFHVFSTDATRCTLRSDGRYRHAKWVGRPAEINELSFVHPLLRKLAQDAIRRVEPESL